MTEQMIVFNRRSVRHHRDRAATALAEHDFLFCETAERLADRLLDVTRTFPTALDLGCHGGEISKAVEGKGGIETLIQCDLSPALSRLAAEQRHQPTLCGDEEALPFTDEVFDLVISNLSLHWVNDLPGALAQIRRSIKPDGLFVAAMLGGQTLNELQHSLSKAEIEIEGGLSPRFSPFAEIKDAGNLLSRAGFSLPVADRETITVSYPDAFKLMSDLRGMGETNANVLRRREFSRRATLLRAAEIYTQEFAGQDGRIPATFEVMFLSAWAPHESQPKPLARGSGKVLFSDFLGDT
jgi:NADH dehydrogenase [ubiquinone] 1 alpha subcomplex assembly factor 5